MKTNRIFLTSLNLITFLIFLGCTDPENTSYNDLMQHANSIKVINTHEHQRSPNDLKFENYNFWTLLNKSYLHADLVSAGSTGLNEEIINSSSLDQIWQSHSSFLNYSSQTSYYQHFLKGLNLCYGFNEASFTKQGIASLSLQIEENYKDYEKWFDECFQKFNFQTFFLDQYWANHNSDIDKSHFSFVLQTNSMVANIGPAKLIYTDKNKEIQDLVEISGVSSVQTLSEYLLFANALIKNAIENGAVALKNSQAYWRTIKYEKVQVERATELFEKSPEITKDEEKELQDFMFHWLLSKAAEYNLPVQIHTGYLAGNGNWLENGKPSLLNNLFLEHRQTKFDLFHGGFPWTGEWVAYGKMFPNVYLNLVWLPQISKQRAILTFEEMLDCVPYNKILWGGDCHFIEETVGSLQFGKEVVCEVLAQRVENKQMDQFTAEKIIAAIFRENAMELFNLEFNN